MQALRSSRCAANPKPEPHQCPQVQLHLQRMLSSSRPPIDFIRAWTLVRTYMGFGRTSIWCIWYTDVHRTLSSHSSPRSMGDADWHCSPSSHLLSMLNHYRHHRQWHSWSCPGHNLNWCIVHPQGSSRAREEQQSRWSPCLPWFFTCLHPTETLISHACLTIIRRPGPLTSKQLNQLEKQSHFSKHWLCIREWKGPYAFRK